MQALLLPDQGIELLCKHSLLSGVSVDLSEVLELVVLQLRDLLPTQHRLLLIALSPGSLSIQLVVENQLHTDSVAQLVAQTGYLQFVLLDLVGDSDQMIILL